MSDPNFLLNTTDAAEWAAEWCRIAREIEQADDGRQVIDEGWMIAWFACAIETGRDHHPDQIESNRIAVERAVVA